MALFLRGAIDDVDAPAKAIGRALRGMGCSEDDMPGLLGVVGLHDRLWAACEALRSEARTHEL
jgi:hypothetical protein